MLNDLWNRIITQLMKRRFHTDDELYLFLMSVAANIFGFFVHFVMLIIFLIYDHHLFAICNIISVSCYLSMFFLVAHRKYNAFGLFLSLEVTAYASFFGLMTGVETHFVAYYLLVIVMQLMVPYGNLRIRTLIVGGSLLSMVVCLAVCFSRPAPIPLEPPLYQVVTLTNIIALFVGTVVEIYVGNMAKVIVDKLNKARIEELSSQAYTDALTGLYNRRYASEYFASHPFDQSVACVAILDIDDFKVVNDTYGHACGDETLRFLADLLVENLRRTDLVFRWGGEEFLLILNEVDLDQAQAILDKIRLRIADSPQTYQGISYRFTVTIGVALIDSQDIESSIVVSDAHLYYGKRNGKNRVVARLPAETV